MEEPFVERRIREAIECGDLKPSEGVGKPISDLDDTYDPNWWAKKWVDRERLKEYGRRRAPRWEGPRDPEDL